MSLFITTNQYAAALKKKQTLLMRETANFFPVYDMLHIGNIFIDYLY